jgi:hypothetical protein
MTAFGKQAEVLDQYVSKGSQLFTEGRLDFSTWEDKNGGGKRSKLEVIVENFQFVGSRGDGQKGGRGSGEKAASTGGGDDAASPLVAALRRIPLTTWVTGFLVGGSVLFVLWVVNPDGLLFTRSTPTGGDLGAHVWGPAFIRDELLPRFRLTGWTPDWYAGFPAYHFYMVVPMLLVVAVDVGLATPLLVVVLPAIGLVACSFRQDAFEGVW